MFSVSMPDLPTTCKKTFVLMSGGVDSTVAAILAIRAGLDVTGVTMRNTEDAAPVDSARIVCRELGIEHWAFDLRDEFKRFVDAPFRAAYLRGETPNPCAICNRFVKFGALWDSIEARFGSELFNIVSGHYARTCATPSGASLLRGIDPRKDQSYFLCTLPRRRVDALLLPLGGLTKPQVRAIAADLGAEYPCVAKIASGAESMDICFLATDNYRESLVDATHPGPLVDKDGRRLGTHDGIAKFTIGQRKGLGITTREPMFVTEIHPATNTVVVSTRNDAMRREVSAASVNVLAPEFFYDGAMLAGKIRSQSALASCTVSLIGEDRMCAVFDEPQFAPAPGQFIALYDEKTRERLVAGGVIVRAGA